MKINGAINGPGDIGNDAVSGAKKAAPGTASTSAANTGEGIAGDTLALSGQHARVQQLATRLADVPDVRGERVAPLRAAIAGQTYQPDSGRIADALLSAHGGRNSAA